jgi:hypothetical protein
MIERHVKASPETVLRFFTDLRRWLQWQGVDAELEPDGDGTVVRLTHRNLPGAAFTATAPRSRPPGLLRVLPGGQDSVDVGPHPRACLPSGYAGHQQLVIAGVLVAHRGDHGEHDRVFVQRAPGR